MLLIKNIWFSQRFTVTQTFDEIKMQLDTDVTFFNIFIGNLNGSMQRCGICTTGALKGFQYASEAADATCEAKFFDSTVERLKRDD
jgi:hypothetical protein